MVDEETRRKLRELGMGEMVEALDLQESDGISMAVAFDDRIWMMVDYAYEAKYISSVKRLAARAKLRFPDAEMGEMIYDGRKIDGVLICEAGTCQFVASAANAISSNSPKLTLSKNASIVKSSLFSISLISDSSISESRTLPDGL